MNQRRLYLAIGIIVLAVVVIGIGGFVYIYATGGSGKASAPISAPALVASDSSQRHFQINPSGSNVQFTLTEVLMGNPNTVVGKTNQVAGDILVDADQPSNSQIGKLRIDARTFATDSAMRDRMIRGPILASGQNQYEYIDFVPGPLTGLPAKIEVGQSYTFQVTGNMTVRDITKPVTFDVTAKLVAGSPDQLEGTATTTVKRADFNLQIPNVATVANVSDAVKLEIDFVAPEAGASSTATQAATTSS